MDPKFFPQMFNLAHQAGLAAVEKLNVVPMVVSEHADPFDDASPVRRQWFVADGPCGFAWVVVRPGNSPFANWLKKEKGCRNGYGGGVHYWISDFNQSMQKKETYADAFAGVIRQFGINAYATSRMD